MKLLCGLKFGKQAPTVTVRARTYSFYGGPLTPRISLYEIREQRAEDLCNNRHLQHCRSYEIQASRHIEVNSDPPLCFPQFISILKPLCRCLRVDDLHPSTRHYGRFI